MSSVIVKGMKMPESCYYCGLTDTSFINCLAFEKPILLEDDCEEKRPDWCPLVALPDKHGRLVDADYFKEHLITCAENGRPLHRMYTELSELIEVIDNAPTIVEAEDE